jgi:hypothetical protein
VWELLALDPAGEDLWAPPAAEAAAQGACNGLLSALGRLAFKKAWLRVEAGYRPGSAFILYRPEITLGRGACDLRFPGDLDVAPLHARIVRRKGAYLLSDAGTPGGTFVNEQRITGPVALNSGDLIRVGRNTLLFIEKGR